MQNNQIANNQIPAKDDSEGEEKKPPVKNPMPPHLVEALAKKRAKKKAKQENKNLVQNQPGEEWAK